MGNIVSLGHHLFGMYFLYPVQWGIICHMKMFWKIQWQTHISYTDIASNIMGFSQWQCSKKLYLTMKFVQQNPQLLHSCSSPEDGARVIILMLILLLNISQWNFSSFFFIYTKTIISIFNL